MKRILVVISLVMAICLVSSAFVLAQNQWNLDEYEKITGKKIGKFSEAPMLRVKVAADELPPVEERLPDNPLVMETWEEIGTYGGTFEWVMFGGTDMRQMGAAPFLELEAAPGFERADKRLGGNLRPGVLEYWNMSEDGKVFTGRIRKGLKFSDGHPVTTEDVQFYFEDQLMNEELTPALPEFFVTRAPLELEVVDDYTFRLKFSKPYGAWPWEMDICRMERYYLLRPAHFCKQFHKKYTPLEELKPLMEKQGYKEDAEWVIFYKNLMGIGGYYPASSFGYSPLATTMPHLYPWTPTKYKTDIGFEWERNPYYYKIDTEGNQLPYIDKLIQDISVKDYETLNLRVISGQAGYSDAGRLTDYPLFMENREKGGYEVMFLPAWRAFNYKLILNHIVADDPVLTELLMDLRFRHALSVAIDRQEVNEALCLGLGTPAQFSPPLGSPWYEEEFAKAYAEYDPEEANRLLDEMSLRWDKDHQFRLRPDRERLTLRIETSQVGSLPFGELVKAYWEDIGIKTDVKLVAWSTYAALSAASKLHLTIRGGEGSEPTDRAYFSHPGRITPDWYKWVITEGKEGLEPPEWVKEVYELREILTSTSDWKVRIEAGKKICQHLSEHLWNIAAVGRMPCMVTYSKNLGNVSIAKEKGVYSNVVLGAAEQWFLKD